MAQLSTMMSLNAMSGYACAISRPPARKSPDVILRMLALCTSVTCLRPLRAGVLEGEADDAIGSEPRDDRDRLGRILRGIDEVLDARVFTLGVLANDHEIDVVVARDASPANERAGRTLA